MAVFNFARNGWPVNLIVVLSSVACTSVASAKEYKAGDKVDAQVDNVWKAATVIRTVGTEYYSVRIEPDGPNRTLKRDKVRDATVAAPAKPSASSTSPDASKPVEAKDDDNPFKVSDASSLREWSDATGKHKVVAEFIEVKGFNVLLKNQEGKTIELPINKLSPADQKLVHELELKAMRNSLDRRLPSRPEKTEVEPPVIGSLDWSKAEAIVPQVVPGDWSLKIDAGDRPKLKPRGYAMPPKPRNQFFVSPVGLLFVPGPKPQALLTLRNGAPDGGSETALAWFDLAGGPKMPVIVPFAPQTIPLAVSHDGKRLVARNDGFRSEEDRLDLWSIQGKKATHVASVRPFDDEDQFNKKVTWAAFAGPDSIYCSSSGGKLACLDAEMANVRYWLTIRRGAPPALSPNGKQLAVVTDAGVVIVDPNTGESIASLPGQFGFGSGLAYSDDGSRLALMSWDQLVVWNLSDGTTYRDFILPVHARSVEWVSNDYLLADGKWLVDLERYLALWEYQQPRRGAGAPFGGFYWYVGESGQHRGLIPIQLPDAAAAKVAETLDPETMFAIKPGAKVSLEVSVGGNEQEKVTEALTKQLKSQGFEVIPNQPTKLVASTTTSKSSEVIYIDLKTRAENRITVTDQIAKVSFVSAGQTVWETTSVRDTEAIERQLPRRIEVPPDKTVQQLLAKYLNPPVIPFFSRLRFPTYVPRLNGQKTFGTSRLTLQGPVQEAVK